MSAYVCMCTRTYLCSFFPGSKNRPTSVSAFEIMPSGIFASPSWKKEEENFNWRLNVTKVVRFFYMIICIVSLHVPLYSSHMLFFFSLFSLIHFLEEEGEEKQSVICSYLWKRVDKRKHDQQHITKEFVTAVCLSRARTKRTHSLRSLHHHQHQKVNKIGNNVQ